MYKSKLISRTLFVFVFFTFTTSLMAQYIIKQIEFEIPISFELIPEDIEFEEQEDETNFILNIPENKLKEAAIAEGREIKKEKVTIYLDGEDFAVETQSEEMGKVTMIFNTKKNVLYNIMWSQKKVIRVTAEDMEKIKEKSRVDTEKMLKNLLPEMRDQIKAEMDREKNKPQVKYEAISTGKKMKISGFNCEEYRVNKDSDVIAIWATLDEYGLVKKVEQVSQKLDELFKSDDDEDVDEWQIVSGKIPIQVRTYTTSTMMGEPTLIIKTITKIEKKKPSADKFKIPGVNEGFTQGSMMDMMMQRMSEEQ